MNFKLTSEFEPTGDQPEAIKQLTESLNDGTKHNTLLGVTGSGKTFTVANVVAELNRPTLVLSHNKTLAAQLYSEFKNFFPDNAVEYFVSYYDYYQPEAYLPVTDTYIEKDLAINDEIEKLRLSAASALLSGRSDVIVISSVSCLYGIGNPEDFHANTVTIKKGELISKNKFLLQLVESLYSRTEMDLERSKFRVKGDTVDICVAYGDYAYRIEFWGDEIDELSIINPVSGKVLERIDSVVIYPASNFVTTKERINQAINHIQDDMMAQVDHFKEEGKHLEAKRIQERVTYDLEMIRELGYCSGIENYSRYFDGRVSGTRPFCLIDYFPDDFLMVVDESHVTLPQVKAMYGGDRARKLNLVEYGFRLPSAKDNRPLQFEEYEEVCDQVLYISATPADYELEKSEGIYVEQIIRPTGLLDPPINVRPSLNQIDDLIKEIGVCVAAKERVLVTTLTKRMAEELTTYLFTHNVKCKYIHSDVDTLDRVKILEGLREGEFDVLVGVNLLREGLDLPEVSLVAIIDADKEGFLRSARALTQTVGRAARNSNGRVIMYADKITRSMNETINETNRRREKQIAYNTEHGITPTTIKKKKGSMSGHLEKDTLGEPKAYSGAAAIEIAADPVIKYMSKEQLDKAVLKAEKMMKKASAELNFVAAATFRDEMLELKRLAADK